MLKKFLISLIIIVALVAAGILLFGEKTEAPAPEENMTPDTENTAENTSITDWNEFDGEIEANVDILETIPVNYTDSGFSPRTITINKGQSVRFVNNSDRLMWVASDFHPTHNIYPEFDADKGVPSGSFYEFKFEKLGTWNYHDHLNASKIGTVIVE